MHEYRSDIAVKAFSRFLHVLLTRLRSRFYLGRRGSIQLQAQDDDFWFHTARHRNGRLVKWSDIREVLVFRQDVLCITDLVCAAIRIDDDGCYITIDELDPIFTGFMGALEKNLSFMKKFDPFYKSDEIWDRLYGVGYQGVIKVIT